MTTHVARHPIPPGIESPEEVQTRLGTLRFFDGFPDDATTQTLFDNLDFQRAVQAYLLALPPVDLAAWRQGLLQWGPPNSTMAIWEDLAHPCTVGPIMNTSTPYGFMWLDLHDGPLVVEVAPRMLGYLNDFWGRWVNDLGMVGPDKGRGGKYLLLPPGYDGDVPDGYYVVRPRTYGMLSLLRGFPDEHGDLHAAVESMKARTRVYPPGHGDDPPQIRFVNVSGEPSVLVPPGDYQHWDLLSQVVQSEPPESSDPITLGMFAAVGIQHGEPFDPDERMRSILAEAAQVGNATARALACRFPEREAYYYPDSAWRMGYFGGYDFQDDGVALLDSAAQAYFLAAAVTPAQEVKMVGAGSQYAVAFADASGAPLDGGKTYRLHLPPQVPVNNFWSVIVYDNQTRSMLQTDQEFPSVSSQDEDLMTNEDGSVDVHFGPKPPAHGHNWVQTLPGKSWFTAFRLYGPLEPWFDKTWRLPDIEPGT